VALPSSEAQSQAWLLTAAAGCSGVDTTCCCCVVGLWVQLGGVGPAAAAAAAKLLTMGPAGAFGAAAAAAGCAAKRLADACLCPAVAGLPMGDSGGLLAPTAAAGLLPVGDVTAVDLGVEACACCPAAAAAGGAEARGVVLPGVTTLVPEVDLDLGLLATGGRAAELLRGLSLTSLLLPKGEKKGAPRGLAPLLLLAILGAHIPARTSASCCSSSRAA
jgi:hypothetical protein